MKLTISAPAHGSTPAVYTTLDGTYRIMGHKSRTWSARLGSHEVTHWVAFNITKPFDNEVPYVAEAYKLSALKKRLERYIADVAAGCARHHSKYCGW